MSSRINPNLTPRGGFKFTDADGVLHVADTLDLLIGVLRHYRERVGRPPGSPQTEIEDQICRRHPALCKNGKPPVPPETKALAIFAAHNIKQARGHVGDTVGLLEANSRAVICSGCPHAVNWSAGCPPCLKSVAGETDRILAPLPVVGSTRNMACSLAKDSLELAVWRVNARKAHGAPEACWRRAPLKPMGPPTPVK